MLFFLFSFFVFFFVFLGFLGFEIPRKQKENPRKPKKTRRKENHCPSVYSSCYQNATSVAHSESASPSPTGRLYIQSTAKLNYKKPKAKGPTPHTARGSSSNPRYDPRRRPRCGRGRGTSLQNWQARSHTHPAPNYPLPLFVSVSLSLRPPPHRAAPCAVLYSALSSSHGSSPIPRTMPVCAQRASLWTPHASEE